MIPIHFKHTFQKTIMESSIYQTFFPLAHCHTKIESRDTSQARSSELGFPKAEKSQSKLSILIHNFFKMFVNPISK